MLKRFLRVSLKLMDRPQVARFKPFVGRIPVLGQWLTRVYQQQKLQKNCNYHEWLQRRVRQRSEDYPALTSSAHP